MSQTSNLVGLVVNAAKTGDISGVLRHLGSLRNYLHDSGAPIGDRESLQLIEALLDSPTISKLPRQFERSPSQLIEQIHAHVQNVTGKSGSIGTRDRELRQIRILWRELDRLLVDAGVEITNPDAERLIRDLRKVRTFDLLARTSDRLLARGYKDNGLARRLYAQALIDNGQVLAGIEMLKAMLSDPDVHKEEKAEAHGLLGRANKQLYVNSIKSGHELVFNRRAFEGYLKDSIEHYTWAYENMSSVTNSWPQMNLIAVAQLAKRDGCSVGQIVDADALARKLIDEREPQVLTSDDPHIPAVVAEAYVALGQPKRAAEYYKVFVNHPKTGPFELGQVVRQLEEVWRVPCDTSELGQIVSALKAALAGKNNGLLTLSGDERGAIAKTLSKPQGLATRGEIYETIVEGGKFIPFARFQEIVRCGVSVARIRRPDFFAHGTGFLVDGRDLSAKLPPGPYLLTNSHVISDDEEEIRSHGALLPKEARVVFEAEAGSGQPAKIYDLEPEIVWRSPMGQHDATLVRLATKCRFDPLPATVQGQRPVAEDKARQKVGTSVAVLGHPADEPLSLSVMGSLENKDGVIVDVGGASAGVKDPTFLHYRTPTRGGNSGSPVFSTEKERWTVVGLHHAGFDEVKGRPKLDGKPGVNFANEGIWIDSIRAGIEAAQRKK